MQNTKRLLAIERIISDEKIYSQETLLKKLKGKGINCTQATLSRNLRQLGVNRIQEGKEGYRYVLADRKATAPESVTGLNIVTAIREIIRYRGSRFNPHLVDLFVASLTNRNTNRPLTVLEANG